MCQKQLLKSNLPIVSVSLKPINFGQNIVVKSKPSYISMVNQIVLALENSKEDCVFFCEHDVLYHPSHFEFTPLKDDVYYYNMNNWRWDYPNNRIIKYDGLTSLSQLCANKKHLLNHFKKRQEKMIEVGLENFEAKDPHLARLWGYEPGRKKVHNGALFDEKSADWNSLFPNIDIRHHKTFSLPKVRLKDFKQKPTGWIETTIDKIDGWDLANIKWS